jgi:hypothetical protein
MSHDVDTPDENIAARPSAPGARRAHPRRHLLESGSPHEQPP